MLWIPPLNIKTIPELFLQTSVNKYDICSLSNIWNCDTAAGTRDGWQLYVSLFCPSSPFLDMTQACSVSNYWQVSVKIVNIQIFLILNLFPWRIPRCIGYDVHVRQFYWLLIYFKCSWWPVAPDQHQNTQDWKLNINLVWGLWQYLQLLSTKRNI